MRIAGFGSGDVGDDVLVVRAIVDRALERRSVQLPGLRVLQSISPSGVLRRLNSRHPGQLPPEGTPLGGNAIRAAPWVPCGPIDVKMRCQAEVAIDLESERLWTSVSVQVGWHLYCFQRHGDPDEDCWDTLHAEEIPLEAGDFVPNAVDAVLRTLELLAAYSRGAEYWEDMLGLKPPHGPPEFVPDGDPMLFVDEDAQGWRFDEHMSEEVTAAAQRSLVQTAICEGRVRLRQP